MAIYLNGQLVAGSNVMINNQIIIVDQFDATTADVNKAYLVRPACYTSIEEEQPFNLYLYLAIYEPNSNEYKWCYSLIGQLGEVSE